LSGDDFAGEQNMRFQEFKTQMLTVPPAAKMRVLDLMHIPSQRLAAGTATADDRPSFFHLTQLLIRHKWKAVAFIVFAMVATGIVSFVLEPRYESTTVV